MKKSLILAGLLTAVFAAPALAGSAHDCQNAKPCVGDHVEGDKITNINPTAIGFGGKGGDADARARAAAKAESRAKAGAEALATQSLTVGGSSTTVEVKGAGYDRYAPPAYAPALTAAGTGVCLGSVSMGLSGPMAGFSFGVTKVDKGCERRSESALLFQYGQQELAIRHLIENSPELKALATQLGYRSLAPAAMKNPTPTPGSDPQSASLVQGN